MEKLEKKQLIDMAKKIGYFDKEGVNVMFARTNGNFYYKKPPVFVDEHETFEITKEELSGEVKKITLSAAETVEKINAIESEEQLLIFIDSDDYNENENRSTVLKALEAKQEELKTD